MKGKYEKYENTQQFFGGTIYKSAKMKKSLLM